MKTIIRLSFLGTLFLIGCARSAYEEKKISKEKVPTRILAYIKAEYPKSKKEKYYLEEIKDTVLYEVELKHNSHDLSLRFFSDGQLYELEKEVELKNLPEQTQENILRELQSLFVKFKIQQVEFVNPHLTTHYELLIKGKSGKVMKLYEIHFTGEGSILSKKEIFLTPIQTMF